MKYTKTFKRTLPLLLIIGGAIGFFASFLITIDKIELLKNPSYIPPCNFNPLVSCGSVMQTPQAEVFGFPNSLIGIAGFTIIITIGMALLAGATFRRWFWRALGVGTLLALIFVYWLVFQSVFRIHALCLYCMMVWLVTLPIFLYTTLYAFEEGHVAMPKKMALFCHRHHVAVLSIGYLVILFSILIEFWKYWESFI